VTTEPTPTTEAEENDTIRRLYRKQLLDLLNSGQPLRASTLAVIGKYLDAVDALKAPARPAAPQVHPSALPFPARTTEEPACAGLALPFAAPAAGRHQDD